MRITIGKLRRLLSEAVKRQPRGQSTERSPEDLARLLMSFEAFDAGRQMSPRSASASTIATNAANYAIDAGLSVEERERLGKKCMERLHTALHALAMKEFEDDQD